MYRPPPAPGTPGAGSVLLRRVPPVLAVAGTLLALAAGPAARADAAPPEAEWPASHGAAAFKDGPPARVSGGFGEESCSACHFGMEENDPSGKVEVAGLPERYTPGAVYTIEATLRRPGLAAAGFQLTARFQEDGGQAGALEAGEGDGARVGLTTEREVVYAHHLLPGIVVPDDGVGRWTLVWTAPESGAPVVFHLAGVAADGDDSQFGDHVFTTSVEVGGR